MLPSIFHRRISSQGGQKRFRGFGFETLESRELLSVTLADLPSPDFDVSDSAYVSEERSTARNNSPDHSSGVEQTELNTSKVVTTAAATAPVNLAPPKSARPASIVTPTTLTVNWSSPIPSRTLNTDLITHFEVKLINNSTKQVIQTLTVAKEDRSALFEGLDVKTRYQVTVTSRGGEGTSSERGTLKISATTATFPAATIRASNLTQTSATLTITDRDRVTPFVDGKTTKNYTIEYVERVTSTPDWTKATKLPVIPAGTNVTDLGKYAIITEVTGLQPGISYFFRVVSTYTDGVTTTKNLAVEGRQASMKTLKPPVVSISKTHFSVIDKTNYDFAIGLTGKVASYNKLSADTSIRFSLMVSTSTKIDRVTGLLEGAKAVADNGFSTIDSKGVFTMSAVSLESIVAQLGRDTVLASKTLSFQLVATFTFNDGVEATLNSKVGRATMPTWYHPA